MTEDTGPQADQQEHLTAPDQRKSLRDQKLASRKAAEDRFLRASARTMEGDSVCRGCLNQYRESLGHELPPECNMTHSIQVRELTAEGAFNEIPEDKREWARAIMNPVIWARYVIGWKAYWYQAEILLCSSRRKVVRAGRRIGKSDAMAISILWKMFLGTPAGKKRREILLICPFQSQVDALFNRMRELIGNSPMLQEMVARETRDPQLIEFNNGATVQGFTSSDKSAKGNRVRGQGATDIYFDEVDYIGQAAIESIMAIYVDNPDVTIWASSTPSGQRLHFWAWCKDKRLGYKEFKFTSRVSPNWNAETELFFRSTYTIGGFLHEFLAEFGESETAVFKPRHIEASMENYEYQTSVPRSGCLYTMGVDWNSVNSGVHIIIVEYDPNYVDDSDAEDEERYRYRTIYKEIVQAEHFTQNLAVERICELNDKWDPLRIYVDSGYGETQIETLRMIGSQKPHTGLTRKVRPIVMNGNVDIHDPITGRKIKKHTKTLMVELAARQVEMLHCVFPRDEDASDHGRGGLVMQMRNFQVERWSESGRPIYTNEGEDTLTAWMLAMFAFILEYTRLGRPSMPSTVHFLGNAGVDDDVDRRTKKDTVKDHAEKRSKQAALPRSIPDNAQVYGRKDLSSLQVGKRKMDAEHKRRSRLLRQNRNHPGPPRPNRGMF